MGIETIGEGIKTRLITISDLRVFAPNEIPEAINELPAAIILPGVTEYKTAMDGDSDYNFVITLIITKQDQPSGLDRILPYMESSGDSSIVAAIYADRTLNSSADTCRVPRNNGIIPIQWGGITYLGTTFDVQVWA